LAGTELPEWFTLQSMDLHFWVPLANVWVSICPGLAMLVLSFSCAVSVQLKCSRAKVGQADVILIKNAENGSHSARFMSGNASYILILGQCMQVVIGDRPGSHGKWKVLRLFSWILR